MSPKLETRQIQSLPDIKSFFNENAATYREAHGDAKNLLNYRLSLIKKNADFRKHETVLDLGCGAGEHLIGLSGEFDRGIGIDFSEKMISIASQKLKNEKNISNLSFRVDDSTELATIPDSSVHTVICIGAFEHMPDKAKVAQQISRVLLPGGKVVILTPNGDYIWYKNIAPLFRLQTRHLSTDDFLSSTDLCQIFSSQNFTDIKISHWTFIPKGDMNRFFALFLTGLDWAGKLFRSNWFRGGLVLSAVKPEIK